MTNGTRREWGVSVTPRPLFTPGKEPVPIVQEAGWASGPVWTGAETLAPTGVRSPDRPARSQSLYRLRYPAHWSVGISQTSIVSKLQISDYKLGIWVLPQFVSSKTCRVSSTGRLTFWGRDINQFILHYALTFAGNWMITIQENDHFPQWRGDGYSIVIS